MVEKSATQPLRVVITTGDEPIVVNHFVEEVIARNPQRIVGMAVVGSISSMPDVTRKGKKNKNTGGLQRFLRFPVRLWGLAKNILVVVLIFGVAETTRQILRMIRFRASLMLNRLSRSFPSQSIFAIGKRRNIHTWRATHVNEPMLAKRIAELKPDIIINQAPGILREEFLNLARLGVLNRHHSLLPKNRGRFSTFWTIYKGDKEAGISIHFVEKELDSGPIVLQKMIPLSDKESVGSLAHKAYDLAPITMTEALDLIESDNYELQDNSDEQASYNSNPTISQAFDYRWSRLRK